MHLFGLTIEIYYDAQPHELQISRVCLQGVYKHKFTFDWSIITLAVTFCCCLFPHNAYSTSGGTCNCVLQLSYILAQFRLCLIIFTLTYQRWHDKYDLATWILQTTTYSSSYSLLRLLLLLLLLLLPLALQPTVRFGLSKNVIPFFSTCHQLSPSSHSQHLKSTFYFLFTSFPMSSPSSRPF